MLYDPKWEKPADVLSIESLIAWLEKQPANEVYDYDNCKGECLYGLYMTAHGVDWWESGACSSRDSGPERVEYCEIVYGAVACERPWTFGAALARAKVYAGDA